MATQVSYMLDCFHRNPMAAIARRTRHRIVASSDAEAISEGKASAEHKLPNRPARFEVRKVYRDREAVIYSSGEATYA